MDIVHVSDIHFGREDKRALAAFGAYLEKTPADLLVISGDLTQTGRRTEFRAAKIWAEGLGHNLLVTPGNHDAPAINVFSRLRGPYLRYRRHFGRKETVSTPLAAIATLKTAHGFQFRLNWAHGAIRSSDLGRTEATVRNSKAVWRLVVAHHPLADPVNSRVQGKTRGGMKALEALASAGADFVLTGHTHEPFVVPFPKQAPKIVLVGAGTLSERTRDHAAAINRIKLSAESASIEQLSLSGSTFDIAGRFRFARTAFPHSAIA